MAEEREVWFCRDDDGECSVWDGTKDKPKKSLPNHKKGEWNAIAESDPWFKKRPNNSVCICPDTKLTFRHFGQGFHGVEKGRCQKLTLEVVRRFR